MLIPGQHMVKELDHYQSLAERTAIYDVGIGQQTPLFRDEQPWLKFLRLSYCIGNMSAEVGELSSLMAKALRDGNVRELMRRVSDIEHPMVPELGDVLWHIALASRELGLPLSTIATYNIEKLRSRQERGVLGGSGDNR